MFKLTIEKSKAIFHYNNCSFNLIFKSNGIPLYNREGDYLKIKIYIKPTETLSIEMEIDDLSIKGEHDSLYIGLKYYRDLIDDVLYYSSCMQHILLAQAKKDNLRNYRDLITPYLNREMNKEEAYNLMNELKEIKDEA